MPLHVQVDSMSAEQAALAASVSESQAATKQLEEKLQQTQESSHTEIAGLLDRLDLKTKAG